MFEIRVQESSLCCALQWNIKNHSNLCIPTNEFLIENSYILLFFNIFQMFYFIFYIFHLVILVLWFALFIVHILASVSWVSARYLITVECYIHFFNTTFDAHPQFLLIFLISSSSWQRVMFDVSIKVGSLGQFRRWVWCRFMAVHRNWVSCMYVHSSVGEWEERTMTKHVIYIWILNMHDILVDFKSKIDFYWSSHEIPYTHAQLCFA